MIKPVFLALAATGFLSFCDTAQERAAAHYQSGLELLEEGDVDRALVEFRNVFKLAGQHRDARLQYANAERARGNLREAFGQYLRLVEQYPDDLPGQRALAELAVQSNDWDAARTHGAAAAELAPDDPVVRAVNAAVAYREALAADDDVAVRDAVSKQQALIEEAPELLIARRVIIDDLVRRGDWTGALAAIDAALEQAPETQDLYMLRLSVLNELGETDEIRGQLEQMIELFPDDSTIPATLVRWYMSQGDTDAAEAFLEQRSKEEPREIGDIVTYLRFLAEVRGIEAASAKVDEIIASEPPGKERLIALRAGFRFDMGDRDAAIAEMEQLIDEIEPSDQRRSIMVMLARMLEATDNKVGARSLIEQVLEEDSTQTDAMKMRAAWLIENDLADEAIVTLRSVLGQAPDDAEAMTLMAQAHERAGNSDLMADMLARAAEASRNAPEESLRYARHLIAEDDLRTAEDVLIKSLRLSPGNVSLLSGLGEIYMREQDWPRLTQVIDTLDGQDDPAAARTVNELTARRLRAQDREDELVGFLDKLASKGASGMGAAASIVRTRMADGDVDGALEYARQTLDDNPDDANARFLLASVQAVTGDMAAAETAVRDLTSEHPEDPRFWLALYNILSVQEDTDAARQAIEDGLAASPDDLRLNWALASIMERAGETSGAIEIYERLYAENSGNLIIANNLASLLTTTQDDDESLDRAYEIARRLRDRDVPAFQDTYGWIAFRRGDLDTALQALEPAAAGLPGDPRVQYHLARTYVALERQDDALAQFRKVVEAAKSGIAPDFMDEVKGEIDRLSNAEQ